MNRQLVGFVGFFGVISLAACSNAVTDLAPAALGTPGVPKFSCVSNAATIPLPADLRVPWSAAFRNMNDELAAISQSVPGGFAGIFYEDNSHLVLTFVNTAVANESRATIQQAFNASNFSVDVSKAEFRSARWSFAELNEWYRYITTKLDWPSGVSFTDIDEKANTINIGVIDETARGLLESQLAALNVSCNLVTTVISPPITIT